MALENTEQYRQNMAAGIAHRLGIKEMGIYRYNGETESAESLNARIDGIIAGGLIRAFQDISVKQLGTNGNSKLNGH
jgi:hypothetical protein